MSKTSAEFTCKCGKTKGWITEGEFHEKPCPKCGRKYVGVYSPEKLTIEAVEVGMDMEHKPTQDEILSIRKQYLRHQKKLKWIPFYRKYHNWKSRRQLLDRLSEEK